MNVERIKQLIETASNEEVRQAYEEMYVEITGLPIDSIEWSESDKREYFMFARRLEEEHEPIDYEVVTFTDLQ